METYGHDFERLKRAFVDFAQRLPFYGVAVLCIDDDNVREICPTIAKPIVTYGLAADARLRATDVANVGGRMRFVARAAQAPDLPVELNLPGVHNVRNALAAIAIGREVGVADAAIAKALAEFRGVGRRFQRYGDVALPDGGDVHADRRLRPPSGRDGGDDRRRARELPRAPARARVPAAPLHAHARPVRGLRQRAVDRRRARADRRLSGGRAADRRRRRPRARARRARRGQGRAGVRREARRRCRPRSARSRATATSSSRWAPARSARCQRNWRPHDDDRAAPVRAACAERSSRGTPLARYTSWRCGGPADSLYVPADRDDLAAFVRQLAAGRAAHGDRPRQQPAGARRRRARHGGRAPRGARRARSSRDGLVYAEAGVASPKVARFAAMHGSPAANSSPASPAPSAARSR